MKHQIFILSDGTGRTAKQAVEAALTQFEGVKCEIHLCPDIRTKKKVLQVVEQARDCQGIIVHTVVSTKLRDAILDKGRLHNVETIDLMGHLLAQLSIHFSDSPSEKPDMFRELNKSYFQRIEALEFAFHHDDGQNIDDLKKAEIVLLGVSRTFKTPLSIYLALKGWRVANVPIVYEIEPDEIIFKVKPERVFCLNTNPGQLSKLRNVRMDELGETIHHYADMDNVKRDLNYALRIYKKQKLWSIINVTNKSLEEISSEIVRIAREKKLQ